MTKKFLYTGCVIIFTLILILMPEESTLLAKKGLILFTGIVLPALFPFMVASGVLIRCGAVNDIARLLSPLTRFLFGTNGYGGYCLAMSALSGYPMGAASIAELYQRSQINTRQAQQMCAFASHAGPIFILSGVGSGMLSSARDGLLLLTVHLLSALLCGLFFRGKATAGEMKTAPLASGEPLSSSLKKGIETVLMIGGYVVLFTILGGHLSAFLARLSPSKGMQILSALFCGALELTSGCAAIAALERQIALPLLSAVLGWGGLSIALQQLSLLTPCGVRAGRFFLYRSVQAVMGYALCRIYLLAVGGQYAPAIFLALALAATLTFSLVRNKGSRRQAHTLQCLPRSAPGS